jgi:hypothetical protein
MDLVGECKAGFCRWKFSEILLRFGCKLRGCLGVSFGKMDGGLNWITANDGTARGFLRLIRKPNNNRHKNIIHRSDTIMMCAPSAQRMVMHPTREDNNKLQDIPESVITAERWLRKNTPLFYIKISAWRNCKLFTDLDLSVFQTYAGYFGEIWSRIQPFVFRFLNVESVSEPAEPKIKTGRIPSTGRKKTWKEQGLNQESMW